METPIDELIQQENPTSGMEQQSPELQDMQMPMPVPVPTQTSVLRDFMGQRHEFISVLLVFFVLLLATNGIFSYPLKGVNMAWTEGRINIVGSVLISIMGSILYFFIKTFVKRSL